MQNELSRVNYADAKDEGTLTVPTNNSKYMKGMKIRDEFICPITYELMREPVVASDGHTYEKAAIEKWLKTHQISPRNGEHIATLTIPNMNLKKLIQDMIDEGGVGFYTSDKSNSDRMFEVRPEKILVLECLGPPESDWNLQSFQVGRFGCVGGRKHNPEDTTNNREAVMFKDITVSRRHFEITHGSNGSGTYCIRDLGSAGGTFIRIPHGQRKQLHPGMIILLGKHQFTVSSIDDGLLASSSSAKLPNHNSSSATGLNSEAIISLVENAEKIISDFSLDEGGVGPSGSAGTDSKKSQLSERLKSLSMELSSHLGADGTAVAAASGGGAMMVSDAKDSSSSSNIGPGALERQRTTVQQSHPDQKAANKETAGEHGNGDAVHRIETASGNLNGLDCTLPSNMLERGELMHQTTTVGRSNLGLELDADTKAGSSIEENGVGAVTPGGANGAKDGFGRDDDDDDHVGTLHSRSIRYVNRRCTLTCCAPDGSPLQGQSFIIEKDGASLGRKGTNTIPLLMKVVMDTGEERVVNVDTAISSEHARVDFEVNTGQFFICDGTAVKPSTNGTWYRLSGPHQESPPHGLFADTEVLIGTVRFVVRESMTIAEHGVDAKAEVTSSSSTHGATATTAMHATDSNEARSSPSGDAK